MGIGPDEGTLVVGLRLLPGGEAVWAGGQIVGAARDRGCVAAGHIVGAARDSRVEPTGNVDLSARNGSPARR